MGVWGVVRGGGWRWGVGEARLVPRDVHHEVGVRGRDGG